jgi:hypothetical protein
VRLTSAPGRIYSDCAFTRLTFFGVASQVQGAFIAQRGVAGELDLSAVPLRSLRIDATGLDDLALPSSGALSLGSFVILDNQYLSSVRGWPLTGLTRNAMAGSGGAKYPVEVSGNPYIQSCDAEDMVEPFYAAGFAREEVVVQDNGPCLRKK